MPYSHRRQLTSDFGASDKRAMFKKKNKIVPLIIAPIDNIARHTSLMVSLPLGYAWLPISCCCVMPTVRYALGDEEVYGSNQRRLTCLETFVANFSGMVMGFMTMITCGCCFGGCCGLYSPNDVWA